MLLLLLLLLPLLTIDCRTCTLQRCLVADVDGVSFGIAQLIWTAMLGGTIACQSGHYRVALLAVVWLAICRSIYGKRQSLHTVIVVVIYPSISETSMLHTVAVLRYALFS
jgi:hypothetical protein